MAPAFSYGALIDGSVLQAGGDAVVGATFLNWQCDQAGDLTPCGTNYGDFSIGKSSVSTGSFAQYNGTFGQILDINELTAPLNTVVNIPDFIIFDQPGNGLTGDITLALNLVALGTDTTSTDCSGLTHCTPSNPALVTANNPGGLSAFNLEQNAGGTTASFAAFGTLTDSKGDSAAFTAIFSATFAGETPQQVLAQNISTNGTSPIESYANSVVLTLTPEPATFWLAGVTLLGVGFCRKSMFSKWRR